MRDLLEAENWDGADRWRKSRNAKAHVLDVNVDFVGRDGVAGYEWIGFKIGHQRQNSADARFDREWEKSRWSSRWRKMSFELNQLRRRRTAFL